MTDYYNHMQQEEPIVNPTMLELNSKTKGPLISHQATVKALFSNLLFS